MTWRLVRVEFRKCIDTRASRILLLVLVALSTGTALLSSSTSPSLSEFLAAALLPLPLLLPVLAILAVTSDWTQRSAVTTFALAPRRHGVLAARAVAAVLLVLSTVTATTFVSATVFVAIDPAAASRADGVDLRQTVWSIVAISLAASLSGVAIGSLVLNTPLAIVITMLVPITYDIAIGVQFPAIAPWISSLAFSQWLANPQWTWLAALDNTIGLGPALCSLGLWILAPLAAGWWRQIRKEVK
jgi:ABC-2 type transport system permease protein